MIDETQIQSTLNQLDQLFQEHRGSDEDLYYSKLAIMEVCGWVEESIDDMVRECANKYLNDPKNSEFVKYWIDRTYGFHYENNFRGLLVRLMGIINVERLEQKLNPVRFDLLKSSLGTLKQLRDKQAHTHITDTTKSIDAPAVPRQHFKYVYEGLKEIESHILEMKI